MTVYEVSLYENMRVPTSECENASDAIAEAEHMLFNYEVNAPINVKHFDTEQAAREYFDALKLRPAVYYPFGRPFYYFDGKTLEKLEVNENEYYIEDKHKTNILKYNKSLDKYALSFGGIEILNIETSEIKEV